MLLKATLCSKTTSDHMEVPYHRNVHVCKSPKVQLCGTKRYYKLAPVPTHYHSIICGSFVNKTYACATMW